MFLLRVIFFILLIDTVLLLWISFVAWEIFYYPAFQASFQQRQSSSSSPEITPQVQQPPVSQGVTAFDSFYNSLASLQRECIKDVLGSERVEELRGKPEVQTTSEESSKIANCVQRK